MSHKDGITGAALFILAFSLGLAALTGWPIANPWLRVGMGITCYLIPQIPDWPTNQESSHD